MEIKIPFYNILNMFLTGLVFIGGCTMVYPEVASNILLSDVMVSLGTGPEIVFTVCVFAAAYEVGLIINRIGSVIIEPIFKKVKLIPFNDDYKEFNKKKKRIPYYEYIIQRVCAFPYGRRPIWNSVSCCLSWGQQVFRPSVCNDGSDLLPVLSKAC